MRLVDAAVFYRYQVTREYQAKGHGSASADATYRAGGNERANSRCGSTPEGGCCEDKESEQIDWLAANDVRHPSEERLKCGGAD